MNMERYCKGVTAGFVATVVLSIVMVAKSAAGMLPDLNVPAMLSSILDAPGVPAVGWIAHFVIGAVIWGLLFTAFSRKMRGPFWLRGVKFATWAWLMMMLFIMPVAGAGYFGLALGYDVLVATLVLHWIYGFTLGLTYALEMRTTVYRHQSYDHQS
jgi:hypothetical protein